MPPKAARARTRDDYAEFRCKCKHLVYADDTVGDGCRFCSCLAHECPAWPWPKLCHDTSHSPVPHITGEECEQ